MNQTVTGQETQADVSTGMSEVVSEVVSALMAIVDAELAEGPGRLPVLTAAMEVLRLDPSPADLEATRREVTEDHESLARALTRFPGQRGASIHALTALEETRDRRLEVLALASQVNQVPKQR